MKSLLLEKCSVQMCEEPGTGGNYMRVFLILCAKKKTHTKAINPMLSSEK